MFLRHQQSLIGKHGKPLRARHDADDVPAFGLPASDDQSWADDVGRIDESGRSASLVAGGAVKLVLVNDEKC